MNDTDTKVTSVDGPHALRENASLLLRLRWVAVVGQLVTIAIAKFLLHVELRLLPLLAIIGLTATTNLIFALWLRTYRESDRNERQAIVGQATLAAVLALDLLALTGLLYFAGGAANPFSIFYLVNLTLCAMLLPEGWGWALAALAAAGLTLLFFKHVPIPELHEAANALPDRKWMHLSLEQWGRVVATIGCALVIIHFVAWITRQLEVTASELQRMERERSRSEKLEALGTFSAGAAHELATPLSTIAVVASDLVRNLNQPGLADAVREDALLIRSEVDHCQMILRRMRAHAGQFMAEKILPTTVQDLIQTTLSELSEANHVDLQLAPGAEEVQLVLPTDSMAQALRGLLQNALDATQPNPHVSMKVDWDSRVVRLVIRDQGPGMSEEAVERAGEPFFTTKEPGRGMGLGLFLTRSVIERLGGRLQIESVAGQGVIARVDLPRQPNSSVRA